MKDIKIKTQKSRITLIGIPFDEYSSYLRGTALAPPMIRDAFFCESSNTWSESGMDIADKSVLSDNGDMSFLPNEDAFPKIETFILELLEKNFRPVSLGGDHSITYPIIKAFSQKYSKINILQFDAHPDLYDEFKGNRLSHACPFARIMENRLVQRLVQVGIRTCNKHQREQAEKFAVEMIELKDFYTDIELLFEFPLYVSFDIDVLDSAFAPGVSHWEPGGLSTRQAINIIQKVKAPSIIGADIVELNPKRDETGKTAMVAAKIVKEIVSKMF